MALPIQTHTRANYGSLLLSIRRRPSLRSSVDVRTPHFFPTFGTKFERPFSSGNVQKYPVVRPTMREREEEREEGGSAWRKISRQFLLLEPTSEMRAAAWRMPGFLHVILSFVTKGWDIISTTLNDAYLASPSCVRFEWLGSHRLAIINLCASSN